MNGTMTIGIGDGLLDSAYNLLTRALWEYQPAAATLADELYRGFNVLEGLAWCLLAMLVLARYLRHRNSVLEIAYAAAFFVFGLSDFREASSLQPWLILAKGANLLILLWLRAWVIHRFYPASRTY